MKKLFMSLFMALAVFCTINIANTAYAEVDYLADAEAASRNISAIYNLCPGMSYADVIDKVSGATEWTKYEGKPTPGNNGDKVTMIHFVKGTADDTVAEDIDVFFCNDIATSVNCRFISNDEDAINEICNVIISNVQEQVPCKVSKDNGWPSISAHPKDDERLRVCINERDNYVRPTTNLEWAHHVGKRYEVLFEYWVKGDYRPHNSFGR